MVMVVTRLISLLYEFGLIDRDGTFSGDLVLIMIVMIRLQSMVVVFTIFPMIISERLYALIFMWDYERNPRTIISALIIGSAIFSSILSSLAGAFFMAVIPNIAALIGVPSILTIFCVFFWSVREMEKKNAHALELLEINDGQYNLSARYQAAENIKSFQFIRVFLYFSLVCNIFGCTLLFSTVLAFEENSVGAQTTGAMYEAMTSL
ncbi:unnamed protein product, partial [Mesorhabditis spiculigera]